MTSRMVVEGVVKGKKAAREDVLGTKYEIVKERCIEIYKDEKKMIKGCIYW